MLPVWVHTNPSCLILSYIFSWNRPCRWTNYLTAAPTIYITQNLRPNVLIHLVFPKPFLWPAPNPGSLSVCPGHHEAGLSIRAVPGATWPPASSAFVPSRECWFYTSSGPASLFAPCNQSFNRRPPYISPSCRFNSSVPGSGG